MGSPISRQRFIMVMMTVQEGIREQSVGIAPNRVHRLGARQMADLYI
jgi:hypothetical protein